MSMAHILEEARMFDEGEFFGSDTGTEVVCASVSPPTFETLSPPLAQRHGALGRVAPKQGVPDCTNLVLVHKYPHRGCQPKS